VADGFPRCGQGFRLKNYVGLGYPSLGYGRQVDVIRRGRHAHKIGRLRSEVTPLNWLPVKIRLADGSPQLLDNSPECVRITIGNAVNNENR
jgi:hypothetical protein